MMRVALVSPYDLSVPGGVQVHVRSLAAALAAGGDEVLVIGPGADVGEVGVGRGIGIRFNGAVAPIALNPAAVARTRRALSRLAPDVVHVHEPAVPLVGPAAVLADVAPVVATVHASSDRARVYRSVRLPARALLRRAAARIAVSEVAARYHATALDLPSTAFTIVPNGVEVARFARARADGDHADGDPTLLFVGRLEPRKGLGTLLRALPRIVEHLPAARVLVVGDGPLRRRAEATLDPRMRAHVRFLGRLVDDELAASHASADVFVAPSLGGESFGMVLLEALAAGTPVVASDLAAYRGVLDDGRCGMLVPPGDAHALAEAVLDIVADDASTSERIDVGRRWAAAHDWSVIAGRVRALYLRATTS